MVSEEYPNMKYRRLNRVMQGSGVEYTIEETDIAIRIETEPSKNKIARESIERALRRDEIYVNSTPGKFNVIRTDVKVYRYPTDR